MDATETTVLDSSTATSTVIEPVEDGLHIEAKPEVEKTSEEIAAEEAAAKKLEEDVKGTHDSRRMEKFYRRAIAAEAKLELLATQQKTQQPQIQPPQRDKYPDDASYLDAIVDFKVQLKMSTLQQQMQPPVVQGNVEEVKKLNPDYDEVMLDAASVTIPDYVINAVTQSPVFEHLKYYLTKNPDKAAALYRMTPERAAVEVGKMEANIESKINSSKSSPLPTVSKARSPITPVKEQGATGKIDESKLSDEAWFKLDMQRRIERSKKRQT